MLVQFSNVESFWAKEESLGANYYFDAKIK